MQTYFKPRDPRNEKDLINTFNRGWPGIFFPYDFRQYSDIKIQASKEG